MQYHAVSCNTTQYHAIQCSTMQYHAIPCNSMQYHAIPCNIMHAYYLLTERTTALWAVYGHFLFLSTSPNHIFWIFYGESNVKFCGSFSKIYSLSIGFDQINRCPLCKIADCWNNLVGRWNPICPHTSNQIQHVHTPLLTKCRLKRRSNLFVLPSTRFLREKWGNLRTNMLLLVARWAHNCWANTGEDHLRRWRI